MGYQHIEILRFEEATSEGFVYFEEDFVDALEREDLKYYRGFFKVDDGKLLWTGPMNEPHFGRAMEALDRFMLAFPPHFVEPGSGLRMDIRKGYVLSDSGSFYVSEGFSTFEEAKTHATPDWDWSGNLKRPSYDRSLLCWGKDGIEDPSFVRARDLWDYWVRGPADDVPVASPDGSTTSPLSEVFVQENPNSLVFVDRYLSVCKNRKVLKVTVYEGG